MSIISFFNFKNSDAKKVAKLKHSIVFQNVNQKQDLFRFNKAHTENRIRSALEIKNFIELETRKENPAFQKEDIFRLIDEIQRDINAGKPNATYDNSTINRLNELDPNLGTEFVNTVKQLATHQNHFIGKTTKINWFGKTNNTRSIEKFKEVLSCDPKYVVLPYPDDSFYNTAQLSTLKSYERRDLRQALTILSSNGAFGKTNPSASFTLSQEDVKTGLYFKENNTNDTLEMKSAWFGFCLVRLFENGFLDITFYDKAKEFDAEEEIKKTIVLHWNSRLGRFETAP